MVYRRLEALAYVLLELQTQIKTRREARSEEDPMASRRSPPGQQGP